MGGNERDTKVFDREQLEKLARASVDEQSFEGLLEGETLDMEPIAAPPAAQPSQGTRKGRTETLHDPLTAALLAEVARDAKTQDFDPKELAASLKEPEKKIETPPTSPHIKRRQS